MLMGWDNGCFEEETEDIEICIDENYSFRWDIKAVMPCSKLYENSLRKSLINHMFRDCQSTIVYDFDGKPFYFFG